MATMAMPRRVTLSGGLALVMLIAPAFQSAQVSPAVRAELAPSGTMRVGINYGNILYVTRSKTGGKATGIGIDLIEELSRRTGLPVEYVGYDSAGQMDAGGKAGAWDVAFFLGVDPARTEDVVFTPATMEFDITYMVAPGSTLKTVEDVDRDGVRIAVSANSTYDLSLRRTLKHATIVRIPGPEESFQMFMKDKLEAIAGPRTTLETYAARFPGSRVLDGRFMRNELAIGTPKGRAASAAYMRAFNEDVKASGFVAKAIEKMGTRGLFVSPPAK
jgi:polar amino acid transport system substrate-binding protein